MKDYKPFVKVKLLIHNYDIILGNVLYIVTCITTVYNTGILYVLCTVLYNDILPNEMDANHILIQKVKFIRGAR